MEANQPEQDLIKPELDGTSSATTIKTESAETEIHGNFSDCVTHAVEKYFSNLDQAPTRDFYDLFIREAEAPLLRVVMKHTDYNQSAAAQVLGLSRGTLRKKLKDYDLL